MRSVRRLLGAAAVGVALVMALAAPSYAATTHTAAPVHEAQIMAQVVPLAPSNCPAGDVCIYANANFAGNVGEFAGTNNDWGGDFKVPPARTCVAGSTAGADNKGGWNDCVSSVFNNTGSTFWFYTNDNCMGIHFGL